MNENEPYSGTLSLQATNTTSYLIAHRYQTMSVFSSDKARLTGSLIHLTTSAPIFVLDTHGRNNISVKFSDLTVNRITKNGLKAKHTPVSTHKNIGHQNKKGLNCNYTYIQHIIFTEIQRYHFFLPNAGNKAELYESADTKYQSECLKSIYYFLTAVYFEPCNNVMLWMCLMLHKSYVVYENWLFVL